MEINTEITSILLYQIMFFSLADSCFRFVSHDWKWRFSMMENGAGFAFIYSWNIVMSAFSWRLIIHSQPAATERISDSQQAFGSSYGRRVKNIVPFNWIHEKSKISHTWNMHVQWKYLVSFFSSPRDWIKIACNLPLFPWHLKWTLCIVFRRMTLADIHILGHYASQPFHV